MEIKVVREQYRPGSTVGRMLVDDVFECYTLEDGIRTNKVYGETAIPPGIYRVVVNYSQAFKTELPLVLNVPMFEGIRIHPGNTPANTLGCILVGRNWTPGTEMVSASRPAFAPLFKKIVAAIKQGEQVTLHVIQENAPQELAMRELVAEEVPATKAAAKRAKARRLAGRKTARRSAATTRKAAGATRTAGRRAKAGGPKAAAAASRSKSSARPASGTSRNAGASRGRPAAGRRKAPGKSAARRTRRRRSR